MLQCNYIYNTLSHLHPTGQFFIYANKLVQYTQVAMYGNSTFTHSTRCIVWNIATVVLAGQQLRVKNGVTLDNALDYWTNRLYWTPNSNPSPLAHGRG